MGEPVSYRNLLWAEDSKRLYDTVDLSSVRGKRARRRIETYRQKLEPLKRGDSIFALYCGVGLEPSYFDSISNGHFFYTPDTTGLSHVDSTEINRLVDTYNRGRGVVDDVVRARESIRRWMQSYFALNTYEISIPSIRDASMSSRGKTGLIVSTLFDYAVAELVAAMDWYDEFKQECEDTIIRVLPVSQDLLVYPYADLRCTSGGAVGIHPRRASDRCADRKTRGRCYRQTAPSEEIEVRMQIPLRAI